MSKCKVEGVLDIEIFYTVWVSYPFVIIRLRSYLHSLHVTFCTRCSFPHSLSYRSDLFHRPFHKVYILKGHQSPDLE